MTGRADFMRAGPDEALYHEQGRCDDLYLADYQFDPDRGFRIRHRVRGPRKDYMMATFYRRIVDASR